MFLTLPPKYDSSASTGPEKGAPAPLLSRQVSRMRCARYHAVFCVTPRSRWSFMLDAPLIEVVTM